MKQEIIRLRTWQGMILEDQDTGRRFRIVKKDNNTITLNNGERMTVKVAKARFKEVVPLRKSR